MGLHPSIHAVKHAHKRDTDQQRDISGYRDGKGKRRVRARDRGRSKRDREEGKSRYRTSEKVYFKNMEKVTMEEIEIFVQK